MTQNEIDKSYMSVPRVISAISIPGWLEEITEICNFHDDKLAGVQYILAVLKDEKENVCDILYKQAKQHMPAPMIEKFYYIEYKCV